MSATALLAGYAADRAFGDPARLHPVSGFGRVAAAVERQVYAPSVERGSAYAFWLVAGCTALAELAARRLGRRAVLAVVLWAALGGRSLVGEARRIAALVEDDDLDGARAALPALVGRDTAGLGEADVCRALVESVAENTADAVIGALVWGTIAGPGGVVAYRAANTLDAMVGHRSERYLYFGRPSARLDDVMGWPGAQAGTVLAAACAPLIHGCPRAALRVAARDGGAHPSPNAGPLEAAFAGALGVRLGGPVSYGGRRDGRPLLGGEGRDATPADVDRAARLSLAIGAASALGCALVLTLRGRR